MDQVTLLLHVLSRNSFTQLTQKQLLIVKRSSGLNRQVYMSSELTIGYVARFGNTEILCINCYIDCEISIALIQ